MFEAKENKNLIDFSIRFNGLRLSLMSVSQALETQKALKAYLLPLPFQSSFFFL